MFFGALPAVAETTSPDPVIETAAPSAPPVEEDARVLDDEASVGGDGGDMPVVEETEQGDPSESAEFDDQTDTAAREGTGAEATEAADDDSAVTESAITPFAAGRAPVCQAGYIYSVSSTGIVREVNANVTPTTVTSFDGEGWNAVSESSSINGMAMSANGEYMYAYERTGDNAQDVGAILRYTAATGSWERLPSTGITTGNTRPLVAGAVDLSSGKFMFGGFSAVQRGLRLYEYQFRIYQFDPATQLSTYKGYIWTGQTATNAANLPAANGDMAFDAGGNLYIVRSSNTSTSIYSVTAANLAAAGNGSLIASQEAASSSGEILGSVNGIAFDASGYVYLGNDTTIRKYDPTTWTQIGSNITASLASSTDLASCNSPANLVLKKNVIGRVADSDQFTLAVRSGTTTAASATTTGTASGIQANQVGPIPVIAGNTYVIAETASGTTNLTKYATTYVCTVAGSPTPIASGSATSGEVKIPVTTGVGAAVECVFTNSPLTASVTITKRVQDSQGQNERVAQGWTVNAATAATAGTVTRDPNSAQVTNASGQASWALQFGTSASRATVTVSETQQTGYDFVSAVCTVTSANGTVATSNPLSAAGFALTGVAPGDTVACTYVNKVKPATLVIAKQVQDFNGQNPQAAGGWSMTSTLNSPATGVTISTPATQQTASGSGQTAPWTVNFPAGNTAPPAANVRVQETQQPGYAFAGGSCVITAADGTTTRSQTLTAADAVLSGLAAGESALCTFVNKPLAGTVTWQKVDDAGGVLAGSEWALTGPGVPDGTRISDCVVSPCPAGPFTDQDPAPGNFRVADLVWGDYTLTESNPPAGFVRDDTVHDFSISAAARDYAFASAFVNVPREGPALPLTGGQSATMYTVLGAGLLGATGLWAVLRRRRRTGMHG